MYVTCRRSRGRWALASLSECGAARLVMQGTRSTQVSVRRVECLAVVEESWVPGAGAGLQGCAAVFEGACLTTKMIQVRLR